MQRVEANTYLEQRLPGRLMDALYSLARKYRDKGIRLFVFGSFATSADRRTSDLDLGASWITDRSPETFTELYRDVQELPTIRKIDLVDMALVDEPFRKRATQDGINILEETVEE